MSAPATAVVPTPAERVEEVLERGRDDGSFIQLLGDRAREDAARATHRLRQGRSFGPLDGVPVAVKDCIDVAGVRTTNGSVVAGSRGPVTEDAVIVRLLRREGAVVVGKTNQSELAFTGLGLNPHFGSPLNPLAGLSDRVPGGSSSGSAVAVAAGHAALAIGTDTSGSVRVPAAFCGIVGYKASEGRFSMRGVRPLSPTLDSMGVLARSVAGLRLAVDRLAPCQSAAHRAPRATPTVLVVPDHDVVTGCDPDVRAWFDRQVLQLARLQGVEVEERRLPVLADAQALLDSRGTLVAADAHALYGRLLRGPTAERLDPAVARRLRAASSLGPQVEDVRRALPALRARLVRELAGAVLVCPTVRHRPPLVADVSASAAAFDHLNARTLRTTMLLSLLGMPGVSVPRGAGRSLGLGLLLSAGPGEDDLALGAAQLADDA